MDINDIRGALGVAPKQTRHAPAILSALDNTPCVYCSQPVGSEARGSSQCIHCIRRQIDLDATCPDPDQVDRILVMEGRLKAT